MALYDVTITTKATPSQPSEMRVIKYETTDYTAAWVGSRTVCRLGTLFKDDPRCKNPKTAREFWSLEEGKFVKFELSPAVWTVRSIFVEGTRKTGKQRMTNLQLDDIKRILEDRGVKINKKLDDALTEVLGSTEGLRVTVAVARRLGLAEELDEE